MTLRIGSNIASLMAQRQLGESSETLTSVFERLASGQRINRASDDAAGLAIADSLNADTRVHTQAIRNANDVVSLLNLYDSALNELTLIVNRQMELAEQAANGSLRYEQRLVLDREAKALNDEFNRIVQSTEYNGTNYFEEHESPKLAQLGYGVENTINFQLSEFRDTVTGTGTFSSTTTYSVTSAPTGLDLADLNNDGIEDLIAGHAGTGTMSIMLGNADGTFAAATTLNGSETTATYNYVHAADFNNDGNLDLYSSADDTISIFFGAGDGSFSSESSVDAEFANTYETRAIDLNSDGNLDLVYSHWQSGGVDFRLGDGSGNFGASQGLTSSGNRIRLFTEDFNADGHQDVAYTSTAPDQIYLYPSNGDGTFSPRSTMPTNGVSYGIDFGDVNDDGVIDIVASNSNTSSFSVFLGNGDATFAARTDYAAASTLRDLQLADLNGDGNLDAVTSRVGGGIDTYHGNGDGSFTAVVNSYATNSSSGIQLKDFNRDGAIDIAATATADNNIVVLLGDTQIQSLQTAFAEEVEQIDIRTAGKARFVLEDLQRRQEALSLSRSAIGAIQSRLTFASSELTGRVDAFAAAESQIRDTDIAQEAARLLQQQILQQAATTILLQANTQPELALSLLA